MLRIQLMALGMTVLLLAAGCSEPDATESGPVTTGGPSAEGKEYVLASEPAGAKDVIEAREHAEADAEIVVVGRIGGDVNPWVDGLAAFTIVDTSLAACSDIEGDPCPTPWDYCCEADVADARTLVKFVGDDDQPIATDARELLGLTELQTVVVQGTAQRDEDGNLTILASHVFVRPPSARPQVPAGDHAHSHDHAYSHDDAADDTDASDTHDHESADETPASETGDTE